jgi:rhamnosyltransferase
LPDAGISASVAIPVRDGGVLFERTLRALAGQTVAHELVICDSGSGDGSAALARSFGARVIEIAPSEFGHGRTRNLLMQSTSGSHVAFLTQDAEPAGPDWLARLLDGFALAGDVAVSYGPYRPRSGASPRVRAELREWFASLSPDGSPRLERLDPDELSLPAADLMGSRGFLSDADACLSRAAWLKVPFRDVPYAEDRALALDLLRAGWAKVYVPEAAVIHSHDYSAAELLRRSFDEWRALREVYGWREPFSPSHLLAQLRGDLARTRRELRRESVPSVRGGAALAVTAACTAARLTGAILGSRADRLPPGVRQALSLERRAAAPATDAPPPSDPRTRP